MEPMRPFGPEERYPAVGLARELMAVRVRTRRTAVCLVLVYLWDSIGATGPNATALCELAAFTRCSEMPVAIY
eukprot:8035600-Lingulodinium_polyedra.AAC.1